MSAKKRRVRKGKKSISNRQNKKIRRRAREKMKMSLILCKLMDTTLQPHTHIQALKKGLGSNFHWDTHYGCITFHSVFVRVPLSLSLRFSCCLENGFLFKNSSKRCLHSKCNERLLCVRLFTEWKILQIVFSLNAVYFFISRIIRDSTQFFLFHFCSQVVNEWMEEETAKTILCDDKKIKKR